MPADLNQPAPRRTKPKPFYIFNFFFFFIFFLGFLVNETVFPYYNYIHPMMILQERGIETSATIIDLYTTTYYRRGKRTNYHAKYLFLSNPKSNLQRTIQNDVRISADQYQNFMIGEITPVVYDPYQPQLSELNTIPGIRTINPFRISIITVPFSLLMLSIPGIALLVQYRLYRRQKWFLEWGQVAPATIVDDADDITGKRYSKLTYRFNDANGQTVEGIGIFATIASNPARLAILQNPTVFFDPANSQRNLLYPAMFVACIPRDDATDGTS